MSAGAVVVALVLTACTTMGPIPPREYIPLNHPSQIWVTQRDNAVVVVQLPRLMGDTLVGYVNGEYQELMLGQTKQVQARRPQPGRTALAIGAGVAGLVGVAFLINGGASYCTVRRGGDGMILPC